MQSSLLRGLVNILVVALLMGAVFVAVNFDYFRKQVGFWWRSNVTHTPAEEVEMREPNKIYIDALGIAAPLVFIEQTGEGVFQKALENGVVHYPATAMVGEKGNAFYFGHSSDFPTKPGNYKTVFALLPNIKIGDIIVVTDEQGRVYRYEALSTHIVKPTQTEWLDQGDRSEAIITLQTSYPVGTAINRFLVRGKLIP